MPDSFINNGFTKCIATESPIIGPRQRLSHIPITFHNLTSTLVFFRIYNFTHVVSSSLCTRRFANKSLCSLWIHHRAVCRLIGRCPVVDQCRVVAVLICRGGESLRALVAVLVPSSQFSRRVAE